MKKPRIMTSCRRKQAARSTQWRQVMGMIDFGRRGAAKDRLVAYDGSASAEPSGSSQGEEARPSLPGLIGAQGGRARRSRWQAPPSRKTQADEAQKHHSPGRSLRHRRGSKRDALE